MNNKRNMKRVFWMAAAAALFSLAAAANGGSDPASVSITATVDSFAEWADGSPTIGAADWDGHITTVSQPRTVTEALTMYTNVNITVTPTAGTNSGILTKSTDTLTTSYKITGDVGTPDATWKAAGTGSGEFFNSSNTYSVTYTSGDGSYAVNLLVQAVSPANEAPESGDYTCGTTLTASW
jgi:hypothetical protein